MELRRERIARNQAAYRDVNEAIRAGRADSEGDARRPFVCECGQLGCNELVELTRAQYEAVRAHPRRFLLVAGHEIPDVEKVIERHDGYVVAEKVAESGAIAKATDPRRGG
ncbi:MAG TPA: hypothetical protein VGJ32_11745 [Solirubrobacteraceae bacterium]|jgi:hypothetical protein